MTVCLMFLIGCALLSLGAFLLAKAAPPTPENSPFDPDEWDPEKRHEYGPDHDYGARRESGFSPRVTITRPLPAEFYGDPELTGPQQTPPPRPPQPREYFGE